MFEDINNSCDWTKVEKLSKGWSTDTKYYVETKNGVKLLLRISDISRYEEKRNEFEIIKKFSKLKFPMSFPLDFGVCNNKEDVYMLLTWVEGMDLEEALPNLSDNEQYLLGAEAGKVLKKIHSIELDVKDVPKDTKKAKKLRQLSLYEASQVRIDGDEKAIYYIKKNIDLIWKVDPVYLHGDFHPGNLIYKSDGSIGVIDFNRWEVGDPYEEFYKLESFGVEYSIPYCIGQIDAYFNNTVPDDFWKALAVYSAHAALYSIKWAEKFGKKDIDNMTKICHRILEDYDGFNTYIPKWYTHKENHTNR